MKAIILAAGKSTRMYPLTLTRPKPLLKILNKTIIENTLDSLKGIISEAIIVVGYKKEMIKEFLGDKYQNIKLTYVEQKEQIGTGHAVLCAKKYFKQNERLIIIPGDDLFSNKDLKNCLKYDNCILTKVVNDPNKWGIISINKKNEIIDIEEKPSLPKSNLASTGFMILNYDIFDIIEKDKLTKRKELELPSALMVYLKKHKVYSNVVKNYWLPVGYPWHYLEANVFFLKQLKGKKIKGKVENNVEIKGDVFIDEGSLIKSGSYIEGPVYIGKNCVIGPHAFLREDTIIMDEVRTRAEIVDSVIMNGTTAKHHSYIGHSVVGENCNIAAGTITADYRHDGKDHITLVKNEKINTNRRKLGSFIGDRVNTGINTTIYPGRKIWPNLTTSPGEIITKDKVE